jgi:hypothetical protein
VGEHLEYEADRGLGGLELLPVHGGIVVDWRSERPVG